MSDRENKAAVAESAEEIPEAPSPNQPLLDKIVTLVKSNINEEAVESGTLNKKNDDLPTLYIKNEHWHATAKLLRDHPDLQMNYLRNVSGVDMESHMETVYHILSLTLRHECAVKVKTDREQPSVDSVTDLWETANWNEREIYDLLGIQFKGHPNMVRIMMPDDWQGYPLRKDYEPLDEEV
jgi:NADH-quinone oxidoreductase subunit C